MYSRLYADTNLCVGKKERVMKEQNIKKESKMERTTLIGHFTISTCLGFFPDICLIILQTPMYVHLILAKKMKFVSTTEEALFV